MKQYNEALQACEKVLQKDSNNIKALYRAGRVLAHLGEMEKAVLQLQKALSLDPQDKTIQAELKRALGKKERALQKEKEMYRRMVGADTSLSKSSPHEDNTWASAVLLLFSHDSPLYAGSLAIHGCSRCSRHNCYGDRLLFHPETLMGINKFQSIHIQLFLLSCSGLGFAHGLQ